jgi:hypothetical protein
MFVPIMQGLDDKPIVIPNNGQLTALIAVLPLQVRDACTHCFTHLNLTHTHEVHMYMCAFT